jgi:nucleobase:cation symporter-1, NCS1 family
MNDAPRPSEPHLHDLASPDALSDDLAVEWRGVTAVPPDARYGTSRDMAWLWFASQLVPVAFFIGVLGTNSFIGLSFWPAAAALAVGNLLGAAPIAALSIMGPRTGLAQLPLARAAFGRSITVVGLLAYLTSITFLSLGAIFGAEALQIVVSMPFAVALLIVFALEAFVSVVGYRLLHLYQRFCTVAVGLGFLLLSIVVLTKTDQIHIPQTTHGPAATGSFVLLAAIAFGFSFGWAPNSADYCRYLPAKVSGRSLFWWVFAGLFLGCTWLEVLGLAAGTLLPEGSPMRSVHTLIGNGPLATVVMIAVFLGVVANITAADYSAGLQVLAAGVRVPRPVMTGISACIAFAVTLWLHVGDLSDKATNLVLLATYWLAPFVAIVSVHWWKTSAAHHVKVSETPRQHLQTGLAALTATIVGFLASLPFSNTTQGASLASHGGVLKALLGSVSNQMHGADLAFPVGAFVGGAVYALLTAVSSAPADSAGSAVSITVQPTAADATSDAEGTPLEGANGEPRRTI